MEVKVSLKKDKLCKVKREDVERREVSQEIEKQGKRSEIGMFGVGETIKIN